VSDEQQDKRGPGRPRKATTAVSSRRSQALSRRLAPGGHVFPRGITDIPLAEPGWHLRTFNNQIHENKHYSAIHEAGWEPLKPEHLAVAPDQLGLRVNEAGFIVRGERGQELYCRMPESDYQAIQARKTVENNKGVGRGAREAVANAVASAHGDEAAEFAHQHFVGNIEDRVGPLG
jgi:hypothetical protein